MSAATHPPDTAFVDVCAVDAASLTLNVRGARLLDGIDLRVEPGEFVGLLGPNGSGKSTLLRTLAGTRTPSAGIVRVDGHDLRALSHRERARTIALMQQEASADVEMTVMEVALLGRIPHRSRLAGAGDADIAIAREALATFGVEHLPDRLWSTLSGGERQRVSLARAITQQTAVLLLDEFTNHLDIRHQLQALRLFAASDLTVVAALHDLNFAGAFCDRIALLADGRIVAIGLPGDVLTPERIAHVYGVETRVDLDEYHRPTIRFLTEGTTHV